MAFELSTGSKTVDEMALINITGNVIPNTWYQTVVKPNGKPYLLAILLLGDIVYWYRPVEVRDEQTGRTIGYKKKFKGDMLQKSYEQYASFFGESKRTIKAAVDHLAGTGVIDRQFRTISSGGTTLSNVMYIGLNTDILKKITFPPVTGGRDKMGHKDPDGTASQDSAGKDLLPPDEAQELLRTTLLQNFVPPSCKKSYHPPAKICRTYTENTTENTTEITHSFLPGNESKERDREDILRYLQDKAEYRHLIQEKNYTLHKKTIDGILGILADTIAYPKKTVRICGTDMPYPVVTGRFMEIDESILRYVVDGIRNNSTRVHDMKAYILSSVWNAFDTIDAHYTVEVNHDLYGKEGS